METLSFAFGVLTMVAVALVAVVVVGIVKVVRMQNKIDNMQSWIDANHTSVHQRIDNEINSINRVIVDDQREMSLRIDELNSYIDSRLDKLESKFIDNSVKKQIING